jgi:small subunit ribosomal protein S21
MIIVNVKENESLDKAIKKFKKKFEKTGVVRELRERQAFTKPSIKRRMQVIKATYKQTMQQEESN